MKKLAVILVVLSFSVAGTLKSDATMMADKERRSDHRKGFVENSKNIHQVVDPLDQMGRQGYVRPISFYRDDNHETYVPRGMNPRQVASIKREFEHWPGKSYPGKGHGNDSQAAPVPEPTTMLMVGAGIVGLIVARKKKII